MSEAQKRKADGVTEADDVWILALLRRTCEHFGMSRIFAFGSALVLAAIAAPAAWGQDSAVGEELRALRMVVEKQSRQIDGLAEQLAKLRIAMEKNGDISLSGNPTAAAAPAAAPAEGASKAEKVEKPEFSEDAPKAEAADGKRHVVIKGETLTSIAKHYNMTLTELKKANKQVDERKLQIGQTLTIPAAKDAEPPPPAKKAE